MSIETRVVTLSRSFRSLIKNAALAKSIKDLKDLSVLCRRACYRHSGPTDLKSADTTLHRDREVSPTRMHGEGQALALR